MHLIYSAGTVLGILYCVTSDRNGKSGWAWFWLVMAILSLNGLTRH